MREVDGLSSQAAEMQMDGVWLNTVRNEALDAIKLHQSKAEALQEMHERNIQAGRYEDELRSYKQAFDSMSQQIQLFQSTVKSTAADIEQLEASIEGLRRLDNSQ